MRYHVRTQHRHGGSFIVPIAVEADTPIEAARNRFGRLCSPADTLAVLVTPADCTGYSDAWVFPVRARTIYEVKSA